MSKPGLALLQDVIMAESFPDLDLALRRGRHVDREDAEWYALLSDGQEQLEAFYRRYGCELIHKTDGYFYLLPTSEKLSRRQLAVGDMLVGQALALLYLDPAVIERAGSVTQEELIAQLSSVLGTDALIGAFNPKKKRYDERIAHKNVRRAVAEAVRHLAALGFVEVVEEERLRLRPALMRFAEPVRAASEPAEALAKLVAQGEVAFVPVEAEGVLADGGEEEDEGVGGGEADGGEEDGGERVPEGVLPLFEEGAVVESVGHVAVADTVERPTSTSTSTSVEEAGERDDLDWASLSFGETSQMALGGDGPPPEDDEPPPPDDADGGVDEERDFEWADVEPGPSKTEDDE